MALKVSDLLTTKTVWPHPHCSTCLKPFTHLTILCPVTAGAAAIGIPSADGNHGRPAWAVSHWPIQPCPLCATPAICGQWQRGPPTCTPPGILVYIQLRGPHQRQLGAAMAHIFSCRGWPPSILSPTTFPTTICLYGIDNKIRSLKLE